MKYRKFGNLGIEISQLGFGCMRLPTLTIGEQTVVDDDKALPKMNDGHAPELEPVFSLQPVVEDEATGDDDEELITDDANEAANEVIAKYVLPLYHSEQHCEEASSLAEYLENLPLKAIKSFVSETLEAYRLLEHADAYRQRISEPIAYVQQSYMLDLLYWSVLIGTFKPFMTNYRFPFTFIPNPTVSTSTSGSADEEGLVNQRPYFRSASIVEIMLETTTAHFDTLGTGLPDAENTWFGFSEEQSLGWSFINTVCIKPDTAISYHATKVRIIMKSEIRYVVKARKRLLKNFPGRTR